ncbi:MAG: PilZ domain-containing protein [Methyloprofundus sp.]|nr:PilZ domain-containing protein [Methyloprofundus sp.]
MTKPNNEKRHFPRFPLNSCLTIQLGGTKYTGHSSDVSLGGLFLTELQPKLTDISLGQLGELFHYQNDERIQMKFEVKHLNDTGIGLNFIEVP